MVNAVIDVLHGEIGTMADDDQTLTLPCGFLAVFGNDEPGALVETLAAAVLYLSDALYLALGEPSPRHNQGLKW
jgi:hypothetical protein